MEGTTLRSSMNFFIQAASCVVSKETTCSESIVYCTMLLKKRDIEKKKMDKYIYSKWWSGENISKALWGNATVEDTLNPTSGQGYDGEHVSYDLEAQTSMV